jgi:hypothetical protein
LLSGGGTDAGFSLGEPLFVPAKNPLDVGELAPDDEAGAGVCAGADEGGCAVCM